MPPLDDPLGEIEFLEQVRQMKAAGASFRAIAERTGRGLSTVHRRYQEMLATAAQHHVENVAAHREELGDHYELVVRTMFAEMLAARGTGHSVNAANAVLRALRQMSELYGLNVPVVQHVRADIRTVDDADVLISQIQRWLTEGAER